MCQVANGVAGCAASACTVYSCASGFNLVNNACVLSGNINTQTDPKNCGTTGNVCTLATGSTGVTCSTGVCQQSACSTGYTLVNGACSQINILTNPSNWCVFVTSAPSTPTNFFLFSGAIGRQCPTSYSNGLGTTMCVAGLCQPTACVVGYAFDTSISSCRPITNDPKNW